MLRAAELLFRFSIACTERSRSIAPFNVQLKSEHSTLNSITA